MITPFHALYKAKELSGYTSGKEKLIPVYTSSNIDIFPYQVSSSLFALRSPFLKGVILCDEGGLGKSYTGLLVISEKWYEGKNKIIIVVPTGLLRQWENIISNSFPIPYVVIDSRETFNALIDKESENPFLQEGIVLTSYQLAIDKADYLSQINWDVSIYDEAHRLRRICAEENKGLKILKNALDTSFKILLTATPMQNSILDLYGLMYFIDESVLPEQDFFYNRYFRKPENYGELTDIISRYAFRTLRADVQNYVKIPSRIPITAEFELTEKEQNLYDKIQEYLALPDKKAFPKMDIYELTMMFYKHFSSSTFALSETLQGIAKRLEKIENNQKELSLIKEMITVSKSIKINAKTDELLKAVDNAFEKLKTLKANEKAVIFTEFRATQNYLFNVLNKGKFKNKVLMFSGNTSRDYTIIENFKEKGKILIATDTAAEGFDFSFCQFIINYDMPYNILKIEQRINRCHRIGQDFDVIVLNFLNKNNFFDVRMVELINKRILQFDSILGASDDIIGNFDADIETQMKDILTKARTKEEINKAFENILESNQSKNKKIVNQATNELFTLFDKNVSEKVNITPDYIEAKKKEIDDMLWYITKYFLDGKQGYTIDDETRTVRITLNPQKIFTGAKLGRQEYSMTDKTLPKSGWHTIMGTLAKNIRNEIFWQGIHDSGMVEIDTGEETNVTIAFYSLTIKSKNSFMFGKDYNFFLGKTNTGNFIDESQCIELMNKPVLSFRTHGEKYGDRDGISKTKPKHVLDDIAYSKADDYIEKMLWSDKELQNDELNKITSLIRYQKLLLEHKVEETRVQLKNAESKLKNITRISDKIKFEKERSLAEKQLRKKENDLYMDKLKLDVSLEEETERLLDKSQYYTNFKREFVIQIIDTGRYRRA